jgi:Zn-dependent protease with chaperone function
VESINPLTIISGAVLIWVVFVFLWQIFHTNSFLNIKKRRTYVLPNTLIALGLNLGLQNRIVVVPGTALFCAGIFHRRVYIGRVLLRELSDKELEAALVHEAYHFRSHDPLKILLVTTLSRAFFFLPAIHELADAYLKEKEVSADRLAATAVGKRYLSRALYKAIRHVSDHASGLPSLTAKFSAVRSVASNGQPRDTMLRNAATGRSVFSSWSWGLTILIVGVGWVLVKNSLTSGGVCI